MHLPRNHARPLTRALSALCTVSLLFFLFYTAPHRVHHLLEDVIPIGHASADDQHKESDQPKVPLGIDCVFQAAANHCGDGLGSAGQSLLTIWHQRSSVLGLEHRYSHPDTVAPFQSRAPPVA